MKSKRFVVFLCALPVTATSIVAYNLVLCPAAQACIGVDGRIPPWGGSGPNGLMAAKIAEVWTAAPSNAKYPIPLPVSGTHPAVIILVQNASAGVTFDYPALANWTGRLNAIAGYFTEVSNGIFTIAAAPETHGAVNDGVIGPIDITQLNPASDIDWNNSERLAVEAIRAANPFINFAAFDTNGDGDIAPDELHIMIYQAGDEKSWNASSTPRAWAHNFWRMPRLSGLTPATDSDHKDIIAFSYAGEELNDVQMATMGQMTHELGHDIGLPDLYDTTGNNWDGLGDHCLMASGSWGTAGGTQGDKPCHIDGYFKNWLGWANLIQASNGSQSVSLNAANGNNDVFRVNIPGANEFFIIENRQQTGYDAGLPSVNGGLAVYHCDWTVLNPASAYFLNNEVNGYPSSTPPGPGIKLEEAHGGHFDLDVPWPPDTDEGWDDDYFRSGLNADFDDASDPNSDKKDGTSSGVDVSNVSVSESPMTFDIDAPQGQGGEGEGEGEGEFQFTRLPVGGWFEVGQSLRLTVEVSGTTGMISYQWVKDGLDIDLANSNVYEVGEVAEEHEGWYSCRVTDQSKAVHVTPAVRVEVFENMPAAGFAALAAGGLILAAIGASRVRNKK